MKLPPIIVLCGGFGNRIKSITKEKPKILLEVNGKPFLSWILDVFEKNKIEEVYLSVSYREDLVNEYVQENIKSNLSINLVSDGVKPLGTGGALIKTCKKVGDEFLVTYGDSYLTTNFSRFYQFARNFSATMAIYKNNNAYDKSNVLLSDDKSIYYNKSNPQSNFNHIDYGLLYFKSNFFQNFEENTFLDLSDLLHLESIKMNLYGYEVTDRFYEIGSSDGIRDFENYLKNSL